MNPQSPLDLSIYVHWPWCLKKCPYCDFNSHTTNRHLEERYIESVLADIEHQKKLVGDRNITSIFFGGGTPSLMKADYIERILHKIDGLFSIQSDTEITIEANPTSTTTSKIKDFKRAGINRISIGVQSFHDSYLKFLGREHNAKQAFATIEEALNHIDNVSFDLIYGLPEQKLTNWQADLEHAIKFGTKHLSAYQLTIEKNTKFYTDVKRQKWQPMCDDVQADFYDCTRETLTAHNFNHYEISNFSKSGYDCVHNHKIWQYQDYIGVGAGAHGRHQTIDNQTYLTQNYRMPSTYIEHVKPVKHSFYRHETLTSHETWQEMLIMGLRIQKGVPIHLLERNNTTKQALMRFMQLGMLYNNRGNIALTDHGKLHLDSILTDIIF